MWHFKEEREKRRKIREKEGTKKEKKRRRRGRGREEKDWEMVMGVEGNAATLGVGVGGYSGARVVTRTLLEQKEEDEIHGNFQN